MNGVYWFLRGVIFFSSQQLPDEIDAAFALYFTFLYFYSSVGPILFEGAREILAGGTHDNLVLVFCLVYPAVFFSFFVLV